jgi:hypothetical protein
MEGLAPLMAAWSAAQNGATIRAVRHVRAPAAWRTMGGDMECCFCRTCGTLLVVTVKPIESIHCGDSIGETARNMKISYCAAWPRSTA